MEVIKNLMESDITVDLASILVLYAILFIVSIYLADDMQRRFQFMDHEEIAEITKSPFPSYMILYHHSGSGSFWEIIQTKKVLCSFVFPLILLSCYR